MPEPLTLTPKGALAVRQIDLLEAAHRAEQLASALVDREVPESKRGAERLRNDIRELARQVFCLRRALTDHLRAEASRG